MKITIYNSWLHRFGFYIRRQILHPNFNALLVAKKNGKLEFQSLKNYETRNESTAKIISRADQLYNFKNFDWILINTDDKDIGKEYQGLKVFAYSTGSQDYSHVCPDWTFDSWVQVQIDDYEQISEEMAVLGDLPPSSNLMGWRGAITHPNRSRLLRYTDKNKYDIEEIRWNRRNPNKLTGTNYVSIPDTVKKWRYLIDVEGNGFSTRVKLFLFSKRVLFLQERPYKEWYYSKLQPWVHYVPLNRDLSDLDHHFDIIKKDSKLEDEIRNNAFDFARNNLKIEHALKRWSDLINAL
jgi:hypothetical protein